MADIVLDKVTKRYPDGYEAVREMSLTIEDGEFVILVGPSGCGKSTALRMIAGLEDISEGELTHRRQRGQRQGAAGPRHRDGVPELRALPAHDRAGEHGLRAQAGQDRQGRDRQEGDRGRQDPRPRAAPRPQARQPLGRPAPARGDGPRDRARPLRLPDGRAAVQPRRQAARADAHRGVADPEGPRHHHRLRDPRPDRGHDPRRPRGRDALGRAAAGGLADGALQQPEEPVRGRLHRLTRDELHAGHAGGRHAQAPDGRRAAARRAARRGLGRRRASS